ncbi:MAG TPA: hypothetical protein VF340_07610, partial [Methyloceanibacter sp.]
MRVEDGDLPCSRMGDVEAVAVGGRHNHCRTGRDDECRDLRVGRGVDYRNVRAALVGDIEERCGAFRLGAETRAAC